MSNNDGRYLRRHRTRARPGHISLLCATPWFTTLSSFHTLKLSDMETIHIDNLLLHLEVLSSAGCRRRVRHEFTRCPAGNMRIVFLESPWATLAHGMCDTL